MNQQIELPKTSGLFDVTVRDGTIFTAYYNPSTRHWINPDTNMEIGFGDVITPIRSTQEQRITKIAQPLR